MKIHTGRGAIPLIVMLAIWSISAITSLPGLAISPVLGDLGVIFPHSTELEAQMLTSIPSLLIIPFVLLSGKLAESQDRIKLLITGLVIFVFSGILYFFAESMMELILISCLLGIGSGLVIPLSTGLISDFFVGSYKTKQLGISSAITNLSLVGATVLTGKLALVDWHYPFIVYLLPVIAVLLSYFLSDKQLNSMNVTRIKDDKEKPKGASILLKPGMKINKPILLKLMIIYFTVTYTVLAITFNLPFLIQQNNLPSSESGYIISLFFLATMTPGLLINKIIGRLKDFTLATAFSLIAMGLLLTIISHISWIMALGVILTGLGYGIVQPMIYDKTTLTSIHPKNVLVLGFVMSMNYLAILLAPFITHFFGSVFHLTDNTYPFYISLIIALVIAAIAFRKHHLFIFSGQTGD